MSQEMNFDEMRNQIAILRNKLEKQEIVNNRMIRSAMQTKVNKMNNNEVTILWLSALCIVVYPAFHFIYNLSWPLVLATVAMMIFCAASTIYIHRPLHKTDLMSADLSTVASILARFKKQYEIWLHYVTPTLITPWITWFCYEYTETLGLTGRTRWICIGMLLVGGFIGLMIGYKMHRRTVNLADEVMRQIKE